MRKTRPLSLEFFKPFSIGRRLGDPYFGGIGNPDKGYGII